MSPATEGLQRHGRPLLNKHLAVLSLITPTATPVMDDLHGTAKSEGFAQMECATRGSHSPFSGSQHHVKK